MSTYFSKFPIITYDGKRIRDISRRNKIVDGLLKDPYIFLPYTIKENEKPEDIALYYYGSMNDTWIVLLSNNITDPYTQWPLSDSEFNAYFIQKYSSISGEKAFGVLEWGQKTTITDNIVYYAKEVSPSKYVKYSKETVNLPEGVFPIRIYEYEKQLNENKREIVLVDKTYRNQIVEEFRKSFAPL